MQFKVEKLPLLNVLQDLVNIVPSKTTLQVLTNFYLSLKGEELTLTATDLDLSMKSMVAVKGEKDGDVTVNARKLFEIIRELPEGNVTVAVENHVLQITSEKGFTCKIAGSDATDFPAPPSIESALEFSISSYIFQQMIGKTGFAVATDNTRQSLNGILWDIRDKEMRMVATDGHKLGICTYKHSINAKGGKSVILSPKAMGHLGRMLSESEGRELSVAIGAGNVSFSMEGSTLISKLIDGPYPNYEQVIPKGNNKRAIAEKAGLLSAIRRVSVLSSVKTHQVKCSFQNNLIELSSMNRDLGAEAKEQMAVNYTGETLDIGFNASFFLEILKLMGSGNVRISMNSPISACLFYPEEDKQEIEYFFLLMPLRLLDK
jgi:DNA polymerase-3 subunit beta